MVSGVCIGNRANQEQINIFRNAMQVNLFNKLLNNFYGALPFNTYFCENPA
jgi:hypothetical protein